MNKRKLSKETCFIVVYIGHTDCVPRKLISRKMHQEKQLAPTSYSNENDHISSFYGRNLIPNNEQLAANKSLTTDNKLQMSKGNKYWRYLGNCGDIWVLGVTSPNFKYTINQAAYLWGWCNTFPEYSEWWGCDIEADTWSLLIRLGCTSPHCGPHRVVKFVVSRETGICVLRYLAPNGASKAGF